MIENPLFHSFLTVPIAVYYKYCAMSTQNVPSSAISSRDQVIKSNKIKRVYNYKNKLIKSKIELNKVLESLEESNRECEALKMEFLDSWLHLMEEKDILEVQFKRLKIELEMIKNNQDRKTKDESTQTQALLQKIVSVPPCSCFKIKNSEKNLVIIKKEMKEEHQERDELEDKKSIMYYVSIMLFLFLLVILLRQMFFFFFPTNHHKETIEMIDSEIDFGKDQIIYEKCLQVAYSCLRRKNH
jgi:hypothetical protein